MNPKVDAFFLDGCGRCSLGGTPECKALQWTSAMKELRRIVLDRGLHEEVKWGFPTYTHRGKNVLMIGAFKANCTLSFFKGSLLKDEMKLLHSAGENSQAVRMFRFTDVLTVVELEAILKAYIDEAIQLERAGAKVEFKKAGEFDVPEEFRQVMDEHPALKAAFQALTPGRQRGYLLHFSQAKQAATRFSRIDKCIPKIMSGKGMQDR